MVRSPARRRIRTSLKSLALFLTVATQSASAAPTASDEIAVGPQYDATHVYLRPADFDDFVKSVVATLGGTPSARTPSSITPTPSTAQFQSIATPAGVLSVFAYETPIPYPFGLERTGWLVTDLDQAVKVARANGAEVVVDKWRDPIGYDAIIQWPGGAKMQLYVHFKAPQYQPLHAVPDTRFYLSRDTADRFVQGMLGFSHGRVVSDDSHADAAEIGKPGETFRRILLDTAFGKLQVYVTDGHLPYPFGYEINSYEVKNLLATLEKAKASGVKALSVRFDDADRSSIMVQFPGGYVAELHQLHSR